MEASAQDFQRWRHNPMTAAVLQHFDDLIGYYREGIADLAEMGQLDNATPNEARNSQVLRGRLLMLREIKGLDIEQIQQFYAPETAEEQA